MSEITKQKTTVIIGGGAAGFFGALELASLRPNDNILIIEKNNSLLNKVRISGGGRCNVTHACFDNKLLVKNYPRGQKELLGSFYTFNTESTIDWFAKRNIELKTENDGRMFPVSDTSETIVQCFLDEAWEKGIRILTQTTVLHIKKTGAIFTLETNRGDMECDTLFVATGGHPKLMHFDYLQEFNHSIIPPVPSLFTFNLPQHPICMLMGVSVQNALVRIVETKDEMQGPVLITHWGLSGPAVLKLSAMAARKLESINYNYTLVIQWLPSLHVDEILNQLTSNKNQNPKKSSKLRIFEEIPQRLWEFLLAECAINLQTKWAEVPKIKLQKLANFLYQHTFSANGKTTFKEEFVTSGGIDLKEIDFKTMQSKLVPGLFFAGEVLNIDAVTGGFNFQAAWTSSYIAAHGINAYYDNLNPAKKA